MPSIACTRTGDDGKEVDRLLQKIRGRHEVGVEDREKLALRLGHPCLQRPSLITDAVSPVDVLDRMALGLQSRHKGFRIGMGVVRGIVQDLDLEQFARVADFQDRLDQLVNHVALIEQGQLDGDARELFKVLSRRLGHAFPASQVPIYHQKAVRPIDRQNA